MLTWTQLGPGVLRRDRETVDLGDLRVVRRTYSVACHGQGTVASGMAVLGIGATAGAAVRWNGVDVGPTDIVMTAGDVDLSTTGPASFYTLAMPRERAFWHCGDAPALAPNRIATQRLRVELSALFARARSAGDHTVKGRLAGLVRSAFENDLPPVAPTRAQARRLRAVRICQSYMSQHLGSAIALGDLAAASGLRVRSLFNAFEAVTGLSPMAYLRAQRLSRVRETLLDRHRTSTRIVDVAADWGFWHMGHFAGAYGAMFGETPSQTLSRARA